MKDLMVSKWRLHFQDGLDLRRLEQDQWYEFEDILTGDESWFFFEYFHYSCWAPNPDDMPEIPKQKVQSERPHFDYLG
jgi:hypothetical protein